MFREVTKLALVERLKPRKRRRNRLKLGRESVFMHCSAGHHAVAIEGYLFVVFSIVDIIVQTISTCRSALQQDGRRYTSVFTTGSLGPCWGRLQCSSDSLAGFCKPSSKGRKRTRETEVEEIGRGGEEKKGREGITIGRRCKKKRLNKN